MGRRNIDVLDPPPDARGGAGLDRRRLNAAARQYGIEVEYRTIHASEGGEADYAVLIDSGPPKSATEPARLALDRAIAAETGGGRDDEHQLWYVALTRARYARSSWCPTRERRLAGDSGDRREHGPAAHGRFAPARARAEGGAVPELQPRRRRHGAPAGDERPDRTFRGVHELERRRALRLHAALLRHRHAGAGPRRALRVLRPVVPVEAAGLPLPAAETYGGTA